MTTAELVAELTGQVCRCGQPKQPGKSFCWPCWKRLPARAQHPLYKRLGHGYEEAYAVAIWHLDKEGEDPR